MSFEEQISRFKGFFKKNHNYKDLINKLIQIIMQNEALKNKFHGSRDFFKKIHSYKDLINNLSK